MSDRTIGIVLGKNAAPRCVTMVFMIAGLLFATDLFAQLAEIPPQRRIDVVGPGGLILSSSDDSKPIAELLQQASVDVSSDATLLRLKVARIWLEPLSGRYIPLYILANPTALVPAVRDSVRFAARELLNEYGGLVNVAFARSWLPSTSIAGQVGPQFEFRAGGKYVQFPSAEGGLQRGALVGQTAFNANWLIRLWNSRPIYAPSVRPDTVGQAGTFSISARFVGSVVGGADYRALFARAAADGPNSFLGSAQVDASLFLKDEVYFSFGYTWSSSRFVAGNAFGGVSLSRRRFAAAK